MTAFTPAPGTSNLYYAGTAGELGILLYACQEQPATLDLLGGWECHGYLIMVASLPAAGDLAAFGTALESSASFPVDVEWTNLVWTNWSSDGGTVTFSNTQVLPLSQPAANGPIVVASRTKFTLGRYGLLMQEGATVTPLRDTHPATDILAFNITYTPHPGWPPPNGAGCVLPMADLGGNSLYCFCADGLIGDLSAAPATGFDVAIRYVAGADGEVVSFPPFGSLPAGVQLLARVQWDPNMTAEGGRTYYSLSGEGWMLRRNGTGWDLSQIPGPVSIPSNFRTVTGGVVWLTPDRGTRLLPVSSPSGWYLVPDGRYLVGIPALGPPPFEEKILCGLSGSEFVTVMQDGTVMTFVSGSSAAASLAPNAQPLLTNEWTTSWVSFAPADEFAPQPAYYSQAATAPMFSSAASGPASILPVAETLLSNQIAGTPFPMIPYGAANADVTLLQTLEHNAIAPTRIQQLAAGGNTAAREAFDPGTSILTTTPQGLLVEVSGNTWSNLILATDGTNTLSIPAVSSELQTALQSSQLFLVITNEINTFTKQVAIAGWTFTIDTGNAPSTLPAGDFANVLIFKFCHGAVADLVGNTALWANPTQFNSSDALSQLPGWLAQQIQDAASSADPAYAAFNALVADPNWNGILALQVNVGAGLPGPLLGLLAGMDMSNFNAHHLAINVNRVSAGKTLGFAGPSSISALIDYVDSDPSPTLTNKPPGITGGSASTAYSFRVLTLLAEFSNSNIVLFESNVILTITQLFGDTAQSDAVANAPPVQANSVSLNGHLENHHGHDVYSFTTGTTTRFLTPASAILWYVDVTNAQFRTQGAKDGLVTCAFTFSGFLSFHTTAPLDIFSFGNDPNDGNSVDSALAYGNLAIGMQFTLADPQRSVTFDFDSSAVAFDLKNSTPRVAAADGATLFTALPLTLNGVLSGSGSVPQQNGYFPVVTTAIQNATPVSASQWYALSMDLDLGTMGSLASLAGFTGQMLVAWSPGGPETQASLLVQLPGTSPGKQSFSLEGVLRIGIGQVSATLVSPQSQPPFLVLTLSEVGLVFLGVTLPSGGGLTIDLFGNPADAASSGLGWYGFYGRPIP